MQYITTNSYCKEFSILSLPVHALHDRRRRPSTLKNRPFLHQEDALLASRRGPSTTDLTNLWHYATYVNNLHARFLCIYSQSYPCFVNIFHFIEKYLSEYTSVVRKNINTKQFSTIKYVYTIKEVGFFPLFWSACNSKHTYFEGSSR